MTDFKWCKRISYLPFSLPFFFFFLNTLCRDTFNSNYLLLRLASTVRSPTVVFDKKKFDRNSQEWSKTFEWSTFQ